MSRGKVVVEIDGKALLAAPDGVAFVTTAALEELRLRNGYSQSELDFVERDEEFRRGCESACLKVRTMASDRERVDGRRADRGKEASHMPYRWKIGIPYERPGSRGMWERVLAE